MRDLETGHVRGQQREETGTLAGNVPQIVMSVENQVTLLESAPTKGGGADTAKLQVTLPQKTTRAPRVNKARGLLGYVP
jgi:hypothetical protein